MISREYIAGELYTAHYKAIGGNFPKWETFYTDDEQASAAEGWLAAADRAIQLMG